MSAGKTALLDANGGTNKDPFARLSPSAKAVVNTAHWLSNSYEQITEKTNGISSQSWTGNWTTATASQLREGNNEFLSGKFADRTAMRQTQAKWSLLRAKVPYKWHKFEVFYTKYDVYVDDYWGYARANAIEKEKAKFIKRLAITKGGAVYAGHAFEKQPILTTTTSPCSVAM